MSKSSDTTKEKKWLSKLDKTGEEKKNPALKDSLKMSGDKAGKALSLLGSSLRDLLTMQDKEIIGWDKQVSPDSSREAYVIIKPIYRKKEKTEEKFKYESKGDLTPPGKLSVKEAKLKGKLLKGKETWPEHKIKLNKEVMKKNMIAEIIPVEKDGNKIYKMVMENGSERCVTVQMLISLKIAEK